jgi:hypothetical protein
MTAGRRSRSWSILSTKSWNWVARKMVHGTGDRGPLHDSLCVELRAEVGIVRVPVDTDDGDVDDVRYTGPGRLLKKMLRPADLRLPHLAEGIRGAVDYRVDAVHSLFEALSRQQVPPDRTDAPAPAQHPYVAAGGTQAVHHLPSEQARSARYEDLRPVHLTTPFLVRPRNGGMTFGFSRPVYGARPSTSRL